MEDKEIEFVMEDKETEIRATIISLRNVSRMLKSPMSLDEQYKGFGSHGAWSTDKNKNPVRIARDFDAYSIDFAIILLKSLL